MDWEQLREKTLGEVGTALASEGVGVTGGFLVGGFLGRQIQDRIKSDADVAANPTIGNKVTAWAANNVPKIAAWYLLRKYAEVEPGEIVTPMKEATVDLKKAIAGSVVLDSIMRLANAGQNPMNLTIAGWRILGSGTPEIQKTAQADIQRLIQENSALRTELNKALQRLATPATSPTVPQMQPTQAQSVAPPIVRYQQVAPPVPVKKAEDDSPMTYSAPELAIKTEQVPPAISERERRFAFMPTYNAPPGVTEREKRYGFAGVKGEKDIAAMFGML